MNIVIVGGGRAGQAAFRGLPGAYLVARPAATAWHAEPGRLWVEGASGARAVSFDTLLLCADEPLLLLALGCTLSADGLLTDGQGRTSVPGVYAAGRILGAANPAEAEEHARIATAAILGQPAAGAIRVRPRIVGAADRLDPVAMAGLLERPPGDARNVAAWAQSTLLGAVLPARPVGLAALAGLALVPPTPRPVQSDDGPL